MAKRFNINVAHLNPADRRSLGHYSESAEPLGQAAENVLRYAITRSGVHEAAARCLRQPQNRMGLQFRQSAALVDNAVVETELRGADAKARNMTILL